mgnify:CR=1 FL=1
MSKMIGLTGGIGAGKTMVAKIFENLGVPVFNADDTAKQLMQRVAHRQVEHTGQQLMTAVTPAEAAVVHDLYM